MSFRLFRTRHLTRILPVIAAAAFIALARGASGQNSVSLSADSIKKSFLQKINAFPHEKITLPGKPVILYQRYPLSGTYPQAAFDDAAKKIEVLLSRRGSVKEIAVRKLIACFPDSVDSYAGFRFLLTPCEFRATTHEKKLEVGSFVKLNREGDFVPSNATRTIDSRTTEVSVRFVMIDLIERTVVFDHRDTATVSDDEAVRGTSPKSEISAITHKDQVRIGILRVTGKLEEQLKQVIK